MNMLIGGRAFPAASGKVFDIRNPATGEVVGQVPQAGPDDVRCALIWARRGRRVMADLPAHRRSDILREAANLIGQEMESLTRLLTSENGKTIRQCRAELVTTQRLFADFSEEAKRIKGSYLPMDNVPGLERMLAYTVRQPVGIVVGIIPFNYPAELFAHKIPGAIAAGASVIVKLFREYPPRPPSRSPTRRRRRRDQRVWRVSAGKCAVWRQQAEWNRARKHRGYRPRDDGREDDRHQRRHLTA